MPPDEIGTGLLLFENSSCQKEGAAVSLPPPRITPTATIGALLKPKSPARGCRPGGGDGFGENALFQLSAFPTPPCAPTVKSNFQPIIMVPFIK